MKPPGSSPAAERSGRWLRALRPENYLFLAGLVGLVFCFASGWRMLEARQVANNIAPAHPNSGDRPSSVPTASYWDGTGRPQVIGRVEIPAIGLVTPLLAGDDATSLSEGAGHIPGTAVPGGLGTVGIAGHRDTHFRLLSKVTPGMEIRLVSREGVYHYRATSSEIVLPEQVSVLAIKQVPGLALVTCYPFQFIGHAPKRYVVHADLVSVAADE